MKGRTNKYRQAGVLHRERKKNEAWENKYKRTTTTINNTMLTRKYEKYDKSKLKDGGLAKACIPSVASPQHVCAHECTMYKWYTRIRLKI